MPEKGRRDEALRAGTPVSVGPVTLLPIERIVLSAERSAGLAWITALKEPHALIVRDARGLRAFDVRAAPVSLDALRQKVPELDAALVALSEPVNRP